MGTSLCGPSGTGVRDRTGTHTGPAAEMDDGRKRKASALLGNDVPDRAALRLHDRGSGDGDGDELAQFMERAPGHAVCCVAACADPVTRAVMRMTCRTWRRRLPPAPRPPTWAQLAEHAPALPVLRLFGGARGRRRRRAPSLGAADAALRHDNLDALRLVRADPLLWRRLGRRGLSATWMQGRAAAWGAVRCAGALRRADGVASSVAIAEALRRGHVATARALVGAAPWRAMYSELLAAARGGDVAALAFALDRTPAVRTPALAVLLYRACIERGAVESAELLGARGLPLSLWGARPPPDLLGCACKRGGDVRETFAWLRARGVRWTPEDERRHRALCGHPMLRAARAGSAERMRALRDAGVSGSPPRVVLHSVVARDDAAFLQLAAWRVEPGRSAWRASGDSPRACFVLAVRRRRVSVVRWFAEHLPAAVACGSDAERRLVVLELLVGLVEPHPRPAALHSDTLAVLDVLLAHGHAPPEHAAVLTRIAGWRDATPWLVGALRRRGLPWDPAGATYAAAERDGHPAVALHLAEGGCPGADREPPFPRPPPQAWLTHQPRGHSDDHDPDGPSDDDDDDWSANDSGDDDAARFDDDVESNPPSDLDAMGGWESDPDTDSDPDTGPSAERDVDAVAHADPGSVANGQNDYYYHDHNDDSGGGGACD